MDKYSRLQFLILILLLTTLICIGFSYATRITPSTYELIQNNALPETKISSTTIKNSPPLPNPSESYQYYIEITDSCGPYFNGGPCVNLRSGPSTKYPIILRLRKGIVLKVAGAAIENGRVWYKIGFDEKIHYPDRVAGDWYVSADHAHLFLDPGKLETTHGRNLLSKKHILVKIAEQMLYAYDGETLFMKQSISTGLDATPTPTGTFWVIKKMPDSYMQGPVPGVSDQYYDLPGVPWDLYFTQDGAVIHGAYWHNNFGRPWSHGCVNLPPDQAKKLYQWAELGTPIFIQAN